MNKSRERGGSAGSGKRAKSKSRWRDRRKPSSSVFNVGQPPGSFFGNDVELTHSTIIRVVKHEK